MRTGRSLLTLGMLALVLCVTGAGQETSVRGSIKGRVTDERNRPLAQVKVRAIARETNRTVAEGMTDERGEFLMRDLEPGRYALVFSSPEHSPAAIRSVEVKAGRQTALKSPVRLRREEPYAVISGATFDPNGFLLPGVRVVLERLSEGNQKAAPFTLEQISNSSGEFAFRVPIERHRYRLTATADGYEPAVHIIEIEGFGRRRVALQLKARVTKK